MMMGISEFGNETRGRSHSYPFGVKNITGEGLLFCPRDRKKCDIIFLTRLVRGRISLFPRSEGKEEDFSLFIPTG
jgi:hypothetical protein